MSYGSFRVRSIPRLIGADVPYQILLLMTPLNIVPKEIAMAFPAVYSDQATTRHDRS